MEQQYQQDFSSLPPAPPPRKRSGVITVVLVLVLVLAVAVILNESLLRIRWVSVNGNHLITWEETVRAAGLDKPVGYFTVSESKIAAGIESNRYLIFVRMEKNFPNSITIYVKERVPVARVQEMSSDYFLDGEGMVLERGALRENSGNKDDMVVVTGLKPKELRVGRMMTAGSAEHMQAYRALFEELEQQGFLSQISELNISDPESIYLVTRDGYSAHLGGIDSLRAKIGTVRAVIAKLREMGKTGGMLEANIPGEAIYTPPSP
ncbi:MAG: FtsQ-type POTRA domain-containing protein [Clostridia bacterium]|nr:FtsQ-type POTRA domain-containing protein [Clostridia bacterium]